MNPRLTAPAAFCREVALPALVLACIAAPVSPGSIAAAPQQSWTASRNQSPPMPPSPTSSRRPQSILPRPLRMLATLRPTPSKLQRPTNPIAQAAAIDEPPSSPAASEPVVAAALTETRPPETAPEPEVTTNVATLEPDDLSRYASPGQAPDGVPKLPASTITSGRSTRRHPRKTPSRSRKRNRSPSRRRENW